MKKGERGSSGGEEASKWGVAAIQAQTTKAAGGRDIGQFLRESFPAAKSGLVIVPSLCTFLGLLASCCDVSWATMRKGPQAPPRGASALWAPILNCVPLQGAGIYVLFQVRRLWLDTP